MIIRTHRFHGYNALRHVYSRGLTARGPLVTVKYLANPRRSSYRAAVVVSRKVHKSAVVRNRIRRRLYEIIRGQEAGISEPYDIVVTVFSDQIATMDAAELRQLVVSLLRKSGIVGSEPQASGPGPQVTETDTGDHGIVDAKEHA